MNKKAKKLTVGSERWCAAAVAHCSTAACHSQLSAHFDAAPHAEVAYETNQRYRAVRASIDHTTYPTTKPKSIPWSWAHEKACDQFLACYSRPTLKRWSTFIWQGFWMVKTSKQTKHQHCGSLQYHLKRQWWSHLGESYAEQCRVTLKMTPLWHFRLGDSYAEQYRVTLKQTPLWLFDSSLWSSEKSRNIHQISRLFFRPIWVPIKPIFTDVCGLESENDRLQQEHYIPFSRQI